MSKNNLRTVLLFILAAAGWFALISQFYLIQQNSQDGFFTATLNFFSYFTILTNLLVAVCTTLVLSGVKNRLTNEWMLAATAVYITIVGITYNLLLRSVWNPQGLQKVTDELLHTAIPILFVIFWIAFVPKGLLRWKDIVPWLVYPLVYSVYTLIHGVISNWYPYPFIDPNKIGWSSVAINSVFVLVAFAVVSLLFIGYGRLSRRL